MRKKLSCKNCDQVFWAYAPSDKFTDVTLEYCEFPDYDFVVNHDCDSCHSLIALYWHDRALEKTHLVEMKELLYLRSQYSDLGIGTMRMGDMLERIMWDNIKDSVATDKTKTLSAHMREEMGKTEEAFGLLKQFQEQKTKELNLRPKEIEHFDREITKRTKQYMHEFADYVGEKEKQKEENKIGEPTKPSLPS